MSDRIKEIRARLDAATPGPNQLSGRQRECNGVWVHTSLLDHAPADIAWLLDEVERLRRDDSVVQGVTKLQSG